MMRQIVFGLLLVLGSWSTSGAPVELSGDGVRARFDDEKGILNSVEVRNAQGKFVPLSGTVSLEILSVSPDRSTKPIQIGRLLESNPKKLQFTYEVTNRPDWKLIYQFTSNPEILRWEARLLNPDKKCVELELNYCFVDLYIDTRMEFNNMSLTPNGYPTLKYRADYIGEIPMTSILDERRDAGLTINATYGLMRPLFSIEYDKLRPARSVVFRNQYIGAGDGISAHIGIDLFGHAGDWRPGLGKLFHYYRPYFSSDNDAIRKHEGNFLCAWYFLGFSDQQLSNMVNHLNLINCEIMFYNPNYGIYAPDVPDDQPWTVLRLEKERFEDFKNDPRRQTTYNQINKTVDRMRQYGIGSFIYFNYIDCSRTLPELLERFRDQIFINAENRMKRGEIGGESLGNDRMCIMHMEPGSPWARHCEDQARKLLKRIPDCDGYFIDMANGYGVYDANHSDGVTVINGRKAYYDAIGIERMQRHLADTLWRPAGKGTWANGPKFPEIARYCDALIAEIPGWTIPERDPGVPQVGLMCLAKPFVYMLAAWRADNDPPQTKDIERHFKYALQHGGFIDAFIPMKGPGRLEAFTAYRPLFDAVKGKRWVFDPHPLNIPSPFYGNIFTYENGGYTVYVFDRENTLLSGDFKTHKNVPIEVKVADVRRITQVLYIGVDAPIAIELPFTIEKGVLKVTIPRFAVAGMLKLNQKK